MATYYARECKATYGGTQPDPNEVCGAYNHCKTHGSNEWIYRSFLWHDLSGIPYKSRILSAKLYVYCYYHNDNAAGALHNFSRVTESWDEESLTWNNMPAVDSKLYCEEWQTAPALNSWGSWDITPLVQEWVDQTYPNYGLQIVNQSENVYRKDWFFSNRRSSYGGTYIEIEYEPEEEYRITRARMEEIVTEVRRITGAEGTLSIAEVVSELKKIV